MNEYDKEYYQKNKERIKAQAKRYYQEHKEAIRERERSCRSSKRTKADLYQSNVEISQVCNEVLDAWNIKAQNNFEIFFNSLQKLNKVLVKNGYRKIN